MSRAESTVEKPSSPRGTPAPPRDDLSVFSSKDFADTAGVRTPLPAKRFEIRPHPRAPILSGMSPSEASLVISQLVTELSSGRFDLAGEIYKLTREACFVNLFFWLRCICAVSGPYSLLNEDLHLEICNFRQSDMCMAPGARFGIFLSRSLFKSTIATHGADSWEVLLNPDINIRITNAIIDRAQEFLSFIADTFSKNELVAYLLPEWHIPNLRTAPGCNEKEFTSPAKTRDFMKPTIKAGGATGSSEGDHYDLNDIDDPIGLDELDSAMRPNSEMEKKKAWFASNKNALLKIPDQSRVGVKGTRYAPNDVYEPIFSDCKGIYGFVPEWATIDPSGEWSIYYRMGRENGKSICPDIYSEKRLAKIARENPWFYHTQIQNSPYSVGLTEFSRIDVPVGRWCWAEVETAGQRPQRDILLMRDVKDDPEKGDPYKRLSRCTVVGSLDPAATDRGPLAKACRSAIEIWAMDDENYLYFLWSKVGFFNIFKVFDSIFEAVTLFEGHVSTFLIEQVAFQKVLGPLLEKERAERKVWVDFEAVDARGEKESRIRSILGRELLRGRVIVCENCYTEWAEEKDVFPQSRYRMDTLDAATMAVSHLVRPWTAQETDEFEDMETRRLYAISAATGY